MDLPPFTISFLLVWCCFYRIFRIKKKKKASFSSSFSLLNVSDPRNISLKRCYGDLWCHHLILNDRRKEMVFFCLQELKKVTLKVAHELVEKRYVNWGTSKTEHAVNTYSRENRKWTSHFEETAASNNSMLVAQVVKNPSAMWETWVLSLFGDDPLWRERLPTPVIWPEESHSLCSPRGRKESDTTEQLSLSFNFRILSMWQKRELLSSIIQQCQERLNIQGTSHRTWQQNCIFRAISRNHLEETIALHHMKDMFLLIFFLKVKYLIYSMKWVQ